MGSLVAWKCGTNLDFEYGLKLKDPSNRNGLKEHGLIGVKGFNEQYDLPFSEKTLKHYTRCGQTKNLVAVGLLIMRGWYDGNRIDYPYHVGKYEDSVTRLLEDIWDYISSPKYKLDRSYGDNLQDSHIKQVSINWTLIFFRA